VVGSDAEARSRVEEAHFAGEPLPVLGLVGGDLWRTLGGSGLPDPERLRSDAAVTFPVDLGEVVVDGQTKLFVAHLVAHSRTWRRTVVAMNAEWRGNWDLGPRSHPNDGLLDVYDARLIWSDLPKVRARLPTGSHLPHPDIAQRRVAAYQVEFERPILVELDGTAIGRCRTLSLRLLPDALTVVV
jgi:diacylglycerol kinase family enzyme